MLVVTRNDRMLRTPVRAFIAGSERPTGFFLNIHDRPGPYMVGPRTLRIDGRSHVRETRLGLSFLVSPTSFFQTNPVAAATLIDLVVAHAGDRPGQHVLDLYAGSGLFALPLVARGHFVTSVEESRVAVADAARNLELNRLPASRAQLMTARVEDALARLRRTPFDVVVLDPPREGCPPHVLAGVFTDIAPRRAIYVSCNPDALARDLPSIVEAGYRITAIHPVDMFPHTSHVETVVMLQRGQGS
jgi:23S rRNA (uracil1939-C5)-methyltransferase